MLKPTFDPNDVLVLWFPDTGFWKSEESFSAWISERMYGGMDERICGEFVELTKAAARGDLDHWADTAEGRTALLIALDQFPRSLWRNTPAAYAQDMKANQMVLEGVENGHFAAVKPWKKMFYVIALGHCEGVDHLKRLKLSEDLVEVVVSENPPQLAYTADLIRGQMARIRSVIQRFGRHPHRNPHYARLSSPDEEAYIETGDFPHVRRT